MGREPNHQINRVRESSDGYWQSCTGCTESEDGHLVGFYPMHPRLGVAIGSGCDECKGKGVVFHRFTKADAAWCEEEARRTLRSK
jgi:hypothetical protein